MTTLMKCGHVANATSGGEPVCVIDAGTPRDADARTVAPEPDLTGRKSECGTCSRVENSDGTRADGTRMWRGSLPFLRLRPDYDEAAGRLDSHYCGCRGWN